MVDLDDHALDELLHRGRYLTFPDFVRLIEQDHPHDEQGISTEVLDSYAEAIVEDLEAFAPFTVAQMDRLLEMHRTDSPVWLESALYEIGPDRVSIYPKHWYDRLHTETDPREYVAVMRDEIAAARGYTSRGANAPGVPKPQLLDAMVILGGMDRGAAAKTVNDMRASGDLLLYPFQNPDADVQLPPGTETNHAETIPADQSANADSGTEDETELADQPALPPLLDIRDDLDYLGKHGPVEIEEDIREVRSLLKKVAERKVSQQEGVLDEIDNSLLRIALETEDHVKEHCNSARTRIQLYRDAVKQSSDEISVVSHSLRHAHSGHVAPISSLRGTDAEIHGKIINEGPPREVIVIVTFYDRDHQTLSKARSHRTHVEPETERPFEIGAHVPRTARYYALSPLDSEDFLAEYQFQQ